MISHRGISVITPLPFGGGDGGGASWGRGRGQLGTGEGTALVGTLTMQIGNVKIFYRLFPSTIETGPSLKQEEALLRSRTCPSWSKKGVFYEQEGRVLNR